MVIFGTFWPFLLLEPYVLYLSVLDVERMRLFHPFEKMVNVLFHKNHPKIEKMTISGLIMAILSNLCEFFPLDL